MDQELEALRKTREQHVADVAKLAEAAKEHMEEDRFQDVTAYPRLIKQHAALGREGLSRLLRE